MLKVINYNRNMDDQYAIVILAAGESKRLGTEKQLLPFKNTFLLDYILKECYKSKIKDIYTILGHNAEIIRNRLVDHKNILINENYRKGMGSSMSYAVSQLIRFNYRALIFVLCDQIHFNYKLIEDLINEYEKGDKLIITSRYSNTYGPPVLFSSTFYGKLVKINGDKGAKELIMNNMDVVGTIDFKHGDIDIDTVDDLGEIT